MTPVLKALCHVLGIVALTVGWVGMQPSLLTVGAGLLMFPAVWQSCAPRDNDDYAALRERYVRSELTLPEFEARVGQMYAREFGLPPE